MSSTNSNFTGSPKTLGDLIEETHTASSYFELFLQSSGAEETAPVQEIIIKDSKIILKTYDLT